MPKITEKDFGKKMRLLNWDANRLFVPLAFTSGGIVVGEDAEGEGECYDNSYDWLPYESPTPPEQEYVLMSPMVSGGINDHGFEAYLTRQLFEDNLPVQVVLKNAKVFYRMKDGPVIKTAPYTFGKVTSQEDYCEIEGELWIKVPNYK